MRYRLVVLTVPDECAGCDRGWVDAADGVVPCPACRPEQHTAWLSGRYGTVAK